MDTRTGRPIPVAELSLANMPVPANAGHGPTLTRELQQEQIEVVSPVCSTLDELARAIRQGRALADEAARPMGGRAVAMGTSPVATNPSMVPEPRFLDMAARFGLTLKEQLTCGFHVHVLVVSPEEGVAVLDRIRVWLPVLLALSANSPYWGGNDSGYESFRYQVWNRWPTAGPCERFGSETEYRRHVESLLAAGVLLDEGMVYFDARLSRNHPTVEVRIMDVCMDPAHAAVIAAVVRALVEKAAQEWRTGIRAPRVSAAHLRLAAWRASKSGVEGELMHPFLNRPSQATEVVQTLLRHIGPVLARTGDEDTVITELARILADGTGSRRQRQAMLNGHGPKAVVMDALDCTHGGYDPAPRHPNVSSPHDRHEGARNAR
ncbi:MAG: putative glutamate--cysteine ligase 2 [Arthrobacter sp.]|jgi:carboxylate-amine ligase|nr:putative glutamate--cysteine ligase 2 [Arthrobacter sp.]